MEYTIEDKIRRFLKPMSPFIVWVHRISMYLVFISLTVSGYVMIRIGNLLVGTIILIVVSLYLIFNRLDAITR